MRYFFQAGILHLPQRGLYVGVVKNPSFHTIAETHEECQRNIRNAVMRHILSNRGIGEVDMIDGEEGRFVAVALPRLYHRLDGEAFTVTTEQDRCDIRVWRSCIEVAMNIGEEQPPVVAGTANVVFGGNGNIFRHGIPPTELHHLNDASSYYMPSTNIPEITMRDYYARISAHISEADNVIRYSSAIEIAPEPDDAEPPYDPATAQWSGTRVEL